MGEPRRARCVHTGRDEVSFDAVVIALGGRELPAPPAVLSFSERTAKDYQTAVGSAVAERVDSIGYVAPASPCWPLPLYELALMTATRLAATGSACALTFDEPADRPLAGFGSAERMPLFRCSTTPVSGCVLGRPLSSILED